MVMEEVRELKNEIKALRQKLGKPNASKEDLLTYEMLGRYRYVVNQQGWPWRWEHVSALYKPVNRIPAWAVENSVMRTWASGKEDLPNSFWNWDATETVPGMALMLSRGSSCMGVESNLEGEKIYSTLVVFVHPKQELVSIKEGAACLMATVEQAEPTGVSVLKTGTTRSDITVLCWLPGPKHGRFFPSSPNHTWSCLTWAGKELQRNSVWTWRCATTTNSWSASFTDGRGSLATWRFCPQCSPRTLPSQPCSQLGTSVSSGSMTTSPHQSMRAVSEWERFTPPSPDSPAATWR